MQTFKFFALPVVMLVIWMLAAAETLASLSKLDPRPTPALVAHDHAPVLSARR